MKIAAIAKVIKDRGSCRLYRVHGPDDVETKFYIGTNSEIYSLEGFPKPWSEAEVMTMLGIEKKKWEDVIYTAYDCNTITDVCGLNLEDAVQNEVECKTSYINLNIGGALLMGLTDPDEKTIDFIAASKLVPVMDEIKKSDYTNYCLRRAANDSRYYVIRDGMIVRAALLPVNLSGNNMNGGQWVDNPKYDATAPEYDGVWKNWNPKKIWVPSKEGLGLRKVFDMFNELYPNNKIQY